MKKILTTFSLLQLSIISIAQSIDNPGFEAMQPSSVPGTYVMGPANQAQQWWGFHNTPETTNPHGGTKSLKLTTSNDQVLKDYMSTTFNIDFDSDLIEGYVDQFITTNLQSIPENYSLSFWYKMTSVQGDTALVGIMFDDKNDQTDNAVKYYSEEMIKTNVSTWTQATIVPEITPNSGAFNRIILFAASCATNKHAGTTLLLDDFELTYNNDNNAGLTDVVKHKLSIYPNPTSEYITFENIEENSELEITTIEGKIVFSKSNILSNEKIEISHLPNGIYNCSIINTNSRITERIVKR